MNPTLYDVLGVSRDASPEEIRRAWREAADRFEPGSGGSTRQFRLFNEAAEVLLDPERRRAYDASLDDQQPAPVVRAVSAAAPQDPPGPAAPPAPVAPVAQEEPASPEVRAEPAQEHSAEAESGGGRARPGRRAVVLLALLALLTAVAVGGATYLTVQARQESDYREALDRAPAAAENAAAAVLSYDYETLEADRDAAAKFLTDGYRKDYLDTFKLVMENAPQTKAKVEAEVLASAAMVRGEDRDPGRVPVLLFVNQTTVSSASSGEPSVALNRVRFDMVEVDGTWLVDGITSY